MKRAAVIAFLVLVIVALAIALNYRLGPDLATDEGAGPPSRVAEAEPSPPEARQEARREAAAPREGQEPATPPSAREEPSGEPPPSAVAPEAASPVAEGVPSEPASSLAEGVPSAPEVAFPVAEGVPSEPEAAPPAPVAAPEAALPERLAAREPGPAPPGVAPEVGREAPVAGLAPSFDIVRIGPKGEAVLAGRAAPGAEVTIYDRGEEIGRVTADRRGEWVWLPEEPFSPGSVELSLTARPPGGQALESEATVVLLVPEPGKDIAGREITEPSETLALRIPKDVTLPTEVLQVPPASGEAVPAKAAALSLEIVDYDETGRLVLAGRTAPGARVLIYLDNQLLGAAIGDEAGRWRLTPERLVAPGLYTLRLDRVEGGGKVVARIELPFSRAEPFRGLPGDAYVVVQPGNSLWRLARRSYGTGFKYTVIYQANQDQIRNPDLIYPGQIFTLPPSH